MALSEVEDRLAPMDPPSLAADLARCCSLVAGALDQTARQEWIAAAMGEMLQLPADLARSGLAHARTRADHLSKIVPLAVKHVADDLTDRRRDAMRVEMLINLAPAAAEIAPPTHGVDGFFDTTDPKQLLEQTLHRLDVGTNTMLARTPGGPPPLPYRDRSLKIDSPPVSDASEALKRLAGVSAAALIDERDRY